MVTQNIVALTEHVRDFPSGFEVKLLPNSILLFQQNGVKNDT